eukprot:1253655-Pyramimonas_sp.AAC.1
MGTRDADPLDTNTQGARYISCTSRKEIEHDVEPRLIIYSSPRNGVDRILIAAMRFTASRLNVDASHSTRDLDDSIAHYIKGWHVLWHD